MQFIHSNGEKAYPPRQLWEGFQRDAFGIWKYLGENAETCCPECPSWNELGNLPEQERDEILTQLWLEFSEWCMRTRCAIEGKKMVLRPTIKKAEIIVDPENPYEHNVLERDHIGELLTALVSIQKEPLVLAVDGAWGSGKTTLFKMWQPELEKRYHVIHFNAWENDFTLDPLVALAAEVDEHFTGSIDSDKFKNLFRVLGKVALKVASRGSLSADDLAQDTLKSAEEKIIDNLFNQHRGQKELRRAFREQLKEIASAARGGRLVFLIDELDRCRPLYAIEFLERIKHLFMVENVSFVLAVDRKQLGLAIQAVYGKIDIDAYLRRFIDLSYRLPEPSLEDFVRMLLLKLDIAHYLSGNPRVDANDIKDILSELARILEFKLRDIEHVVRNVVLAIRATVPGQILPLDMLTVLASIKLHNEDLYQSFCHGKKSAWEVFQMLPPVFTAEEFMVPANPSYSRVKPRIYATLYYMDKSLNGENAPKEHHDDSLFGSSAEEVELFIKMYVRQYPTSDGETIRQLAYTKLELSKALI